MSLTLCCPVCRDALAREAATWRCPQGHSFDVAADGHVNLLPSGRHRRRAAGDSAAMVRSRRQFLHAGHYDPLAHALVDAQPSIRHFARARTNER